MIPTVNRKGGEKVDYPKITLEAARVNAHLQQKQAAKQLGLSPVTLASYEKGKTYPPIDVMQKICNLYKFPMEYIFLPQH